MKVKVGSKRKVALWFMLFTIVSLVVFVNFYKPPFGYLRVERMLLPENTELAKKFQAIQPRRSLSPAK